MKTPGNNCCNLPLNTTEEEKEKIQEATASWADEEITMDASVTAVLSELDGISALKDDQRTVLKAFLGEQNVFTLLPTGIGKS